MKNAIIVPGRPDFDEYYDPERPTNSNDHWFPWITKQLMQNDIHAVSVEMLKAYQPRYDIWERELERFDITSETILIGHSCGAGFIVRYLSEHPKLSVDKVILVAPWINPEDNPLSDTADFFHFDIDPNFINRTSSLTIFVSNDDEPSVLKSVEIICETAPGATVREFTGKKHFCASDLGGPAFPELAEALLS